LVPVTDSTIFGIASATDLILSPAFFCYVTVLIAPTTSGATAVAVSMAFLTFGLLSRALSALSFAALPTADVMVGIISVTVPVVGPF
jgi:hypothetical protein